MKIEFDQHFLENTNILEKEIEISQIKSNDLIVEIGPGNCNLTKLILEKKPKKLISIEKDEKFEKNLQKIKEIYPKIFEYKIGNGIEEIKNIKFTKLISNIPYSITEPLYKFLMKNKIKFAVLIHGNKFYNQILNKNSKWNYFINSFYDVKLIEKIDGEKFNPITKVKSVLLKLELKEINKLSKKDLFFQFLFLKQNRNIKNAIIYSLVEIEFTKKEAIEIENKLNLNEKIKNMKLENISNKSFIYIIRNLVKKIVKIT